MLVQFVFAFIYSILFALILSFIFKRHAPGPFGGVLYFFAIMFFFTLAIGAWIHPVGPMFRNVPWLGILGGAFLIMLLIAELLPHKEKAVYIKKRADLIKEENKDEEVLEKEFGILIWVIIIALIIAIIYAVRFLSIKGGAPGVSAILF